MNSLQSNKSEYLSTVDRIYSLNEKRKSQKNVIKLYKNRLKKNGINIPSDSSFLTETSRTQYDLKRERELREKLKKVSTEEELWKKRAHELASKLRGLARIQLQNPSGNIQKNPIFNHQFETMIEDFKEEQRDKEEMKKHVAELEKRIERCRKLLSTAKLVTESVDDKLRTIATRRKEALDYPLGIQESGDTADMKPAEKS